MEEKNKKPQPKVYRGDFCFKYFPKHSFKKFQQELKHTEEELIEMMPTNIRKINNRFIETKRYLAAAYWTIDILFISFCHKIRLLNTILPNQWVMFAFKIACVIGPAYLYIQIEEKAIKEHHARLYQLIEDQYRSYENCGDLLVLNKETQIFDVVWEDDKISELK